MLRACLLVRLGPSINYTVVVSSATACTHSLTKLIKRETLHSTRAIISESVLWLEDEEAA